MPDSDGTNGSHFLWAIGGFAFASWLLRRQIDESKKSRAEMDDPDGAEEIYNEIKELLHEWEPEGFDSEDDYMKDLAEYLEEYSDWAIEVCPNTSEGKPDIVIGDLLALELKLTPSKGECDRAVGQCAGYSREWMTWLVLIDTNVTQVGRIENLLQDKGLEQIEVWSFS